MLYLLNLDACVIASYVRLVKSNSLMQWYAYGRVDTVYVAHVATERTPGAGI